MKKKHIKILLITVRTEFFLYMQSNIVVSFLALAELN